SFMLPNNRGPRVCSEWKFSNLNVVSSFLSLHLSQTNAANLRMAIGAIGNVFRIDRLSLLASDLGHRDDSFHRANMRQLWCTQNNIADRINPRLNSLHPAVGFYKAAISLDLGSFQTNVLSTRLASNCDQNLFSLDLLLLAVHGNGASNTRLRLLHLFN